MTDKRDDMSDDGLSPLPLPEQPPMDDAAGGPQADDAEPNDPEAPRTPVTD